jgi:hypothetical protein
MCRLVFVIQSDIIVCGNGRMLTAPYAHLPVLRRNPKYLTRAWCLFELYTAIGKAHIDVDIVLTEQQHTDFVQTMASDGYGCIDAAFDGIHSESATASREPDLKAIRAVVESTPGGFATLDNTVRHVRCPPLLRSRMGSLSAEYYSSDCTTSSKRVFGC